MSKLVSGELWALFEPLLPAPKPRRFQFSGRKPVDNRVALSVILFVLKTGIPWEDVPHAGALWAADAAAWRRGKSCASGKRRAYGRSFTHSSCKSWKRKESSTGSELW